MKPFLSEINAVIQIYLCTITKDAWAREEFCRDFCPFCFFNGKSTKCAEKL